MHGSLGTMSCPELFQLAGQGLGYRITQVLNHRTSMPFQPTVKLCIGFRTQESSDLWTGKLVLGDHKVL